MLATAPLVLWDIDQINMIYAGFSTRGKNTYFEVLPTATYRQIIELYFVDILNRI